MDTKFRAGDRILCIERVRGIYKDSRLPTYGRLPLLNEVYTVKQTNILNGVCLVGFEESRFFSGNKFTAVELLII
jgi:hypothetical protein